MSRKESYLPDYAVETRYPGDYEPMNEADYADALEIAEHTLTRVAKIIK